MKHVLATGTDGPLMHVRAVQVDGPSRIEHGLIVSDAPSYDLWWVRPMTSRSEPVDGTADIPTVLACSMFNAALAYDA